MPETIGAAEICALLTGLIRAMVRDRDAVSVTPLPSVVSGSTILEVTVSARDMGRIIGRQGRIARSLRIIVLAIGTEQQHLYKLDLNGISGGSDDCEAP